MSLATCEDCGLLFTNCTKCPATCYDVQVPDACVEDDDCLPGCICPPGYVFETSTGNCVKNETCPCLDDQGNEFDVGFCNTTSDGCEKWYVI